MGRIATHARAVLLLVLLWPLGCAHPEKARSLEGVPVVRVRLLQDQHLVILTASKPPTARPGTGESRALNIPRGTPVPLRLVAGGWRLAEEDLGTGELTLQPDGDGSVSVNGTAYRGRYRFVPTPTGAFDVVNDVDVDGYLKSVVPKELPWNWHDEAYRAQAITARTYALYESATAGRGYYDVNDDVRSQVYGGLSAESAKSRAAVDSTAGVVLATKTDNGYKIFKAYFSSCCGGATSSAADAFNEPFTKPLSARYVGPLCKDSPRFNWGPVVMPKTELTRRLRLWGNARQHPLKDMADVVAVNVLTANEFGRPTRFVVTDARGNRYALSGEEMRWSVNAGGVVLNSSFFKPVNETDTIRFAEGHGWGHGVGLCQWCAEALAEDGVRHEDILLASFPSSRLVRAY